MIVAGIVLYNPDKKRLLENIKEAMIQVGKVILVDNDSDNFSEIKEIVHSNYQDIIIIHNEKNMGIAYALNQLIMSSHNYNWLLTLDQDSVMEPGFIESYKKCLDIPNIALISPFIQDRNGPLLIKKNGVEFIDMCITSGTLMNLEICKKIGGFNNDMFIDFVDFEYCYRVRKNGYKIVRNNDAILIHELGVGRVYDFYIKKFFVSEHSPSRHYYLVRNCCCLFHKYSDFKFLYHIVKDLAYVLFFEHEKKKKIIKIIDGLKAGVCRHL